MTEPSAGRENDPSGQTPNTSLRARIDDIATRFTAWFSRIMDRLVSPLMPPEPEKKSAAEAAPDWDPNMPYTPDSPGLYMLLTGVTLIQRGYDREARWMEVSAYPEAGYLRGQDYGHGQNILLDITLDADLPEPDVDWWFQQMTSWAMTETPLVLMGRESDVAVLVNDMDPSQWAPVPVE